MPIWTLSWKYKTLFFCLVCGNKQIATIITQHVLLYSTLVVQFICISKGGITEQWVYLQLLFWFEIIVPVKLSRHFGTGSWSLWCKSLNSLLPLPTTDFAHDDFLRRYSSAFYLYIKLLAVSEANQDRSGKLGDLALYVYICLGITFEPKDLFYIKFGRSTDWQESNQIKGKVRTLPK